MSGAEGQRFGPGRGDDQLMLSLEGEARMEGYMARLSLEDLAAIAGSPAGTSLAVLARQLRQPYITVAVAAWRIRQAGGWFSRIEWRSCLECGEALAWAPK